MLRLWGGGDRRRRQFCYYEGPDSTTFERETVQNNNEREF